MNIHEILCISIKEFRYHFCVVERDKNSVGHVIKSYYYLLLCILMTEHDDLYQVTKDTLCNKSINVFEVMI